jgi:hypothetical protein
MNSSTVLKKIMTLLSAEKVETKVELVTASLVDGTVVESPTFDVGEPVEVIAEDGSKSPAPDGEHELFLRDEEGNEVRIRIITKDGVIVERENVEEEALEEEPKEEEVKLEEESNEEEEKEVSLEDVKKSVEEMAYRIDELEKKLADMQVEEEEKEEESMEEEEELPKLDGAPVQASKANVSPAGSKARKTRQSAFLEKLYKNN